MKRVNIAGHSIEFYDSIENLPISQFHKYGKYVLVDAGIGDSLSDIDNHLGKIIDFLGVDTEKAHKELLNLRQNIYMVLTEQDLRHKSTVCLVKSVDGKDWTDFSDGGIEELYQMVRPAAIAVLDSTMKSIREKIDAELMIYFPSIYDTAHDKNVLVLMRKRAILQLEEIVYSVDHKQDIKALTERIMALEKVEEFDGDNNAEIAFDKQFEDMCVAMAREFGGSVKGYTVMEFYSAYERLEKEQKEMKKRLKKK